MGGLDERVRVRRHCGPLCSNLVAAVSSSICITVVRVSGVGVIVLSEQTVVLAAQKQRNKALTLAYAQTIHYTSN